jgi:hypothetical protein
MRYERLHHQSRRKQPYCQEKNKFVEMRFCGRPAQKQEDSRKEL